MDDFQNEYEQLKYVNSPYYNDICYHVLTRCTQILFPVSAQIEQTKMTYKYVTQYRGKEAIYMIH